jgi:exopolysaccharide biosynthesis predicted pyruvyltransferase EpsI
MKKTNTIFALGAYDRFNYGDLLFPIISKNFLTRHYPDINFECYALVNSDYSKWGGLKTKPISNLHNKSLVKNGDIIYFCGGGILGADWLSMHANLLGNLGNVALYYMSRILGYHLANNLSRLYFRAKSEFPWIASPDDFDAQVKVIYNSAGGSELAKLPEEIKDLALKKLSSATYLSVRDTETKKICSSSQNKTPVHLSPDSAVLMSEQFSLSYLESKTNSDLMNLISMKNYVCFHSNYNYLRKNINEIATQLETIYYQYGFKTILLPIGRYIGLDDHKGLLELKKLISTPVEIVSENVTIWEIMHTIAAASLFIGTSLHGNVTAQSFAVPHIGLSSKKSKLDFYLETWDIPEQSFCPEINQLPNMVNDVLAVPVSTRLQKKEQLISIASGNLHNIMKIAFN